MRICVKKLRDVVFTYTNGIIYYGKLIQKNEYHISVNLPVYDKGFIIYKSKNKPLFRNIPTLTILFSPIIILSIVSLIPVTVFLFLFEILIAFYLRTLYKKGFISGSVERLSGYMSLILSIIGVFSVIKYLFL